ncbi:thiol reductant ABC exporter subunit CydC [Sutcliffiella horikoshii]|uniref:Thiol reductant ABC exporter subunit CydC n=1 Tax=Sutcliffiella horikoshii TaxID=79883 RepID=A0ABM6KEN0_9BACI|nr:thiol reductant ABC exporter subunit CydC [Sutcliffiella horikoshii]ART74771.1 thiol reductant ABC exporter subunit CydC [Sutcliffiella horikoshii]
MRELAHVVKLVMMEKKDILLSILLGFSAGITAVGLFASSGYLISKAALAPPIYTLTVMIAVLKLFGFARAFVRYGERLYSHRATFTILSNLRVAFYKKIEPLAPQIFQKYRSGDLLARIVGDVESLQNFFLRVFYPPVVLVLVFLSTIFFISFFSIYLALVMFVGLILTGFVVPAYFALGQRRLQSRVREERGALSTEVTELFYGFRDLKIYQQLDVKEKLLADAAGSYVGEQEREGKQAMFNQSMNTFITLLVSWALLALGAYLTVEGQFEGLFLAMLVMISLTVFENAAPMAVFPNHYEESRRAAERLDEVVDGEPVVGVASSETVELPVGTAFSFEMKDVHFRYPGESRLTLDGVNISLPAGSKTAIVGPSGSGKSTLLQLLLKIYETEDGNVSLDAWDYASVDQEDLWGVANVVLQENHFFYGTVRENLALAKDGLSDEEMVEALSAVKLDGFSLDDAVLEKGENLSGGEKQRLAIARALLRSERLWLLDEPTSSVDAVTEAAIFEKLFEAAAEDTLVLVSHRLTGLEKMDQIVVMENGRVVEAGTFDELIRMKGYFYEMKEIEKSVFM